jgi:epsilon-lactone hydrolase
MEKSPHFKPEQCALLLIDHQVGTIQLIRNMAQAARDLAALRPVAVCVMSPWTDLALTGDSVKTRAGHDPMLSRRSLEDARQLYLGRRSAQDPRVSPLYGDLAGAPPVLLHVGEDEILLEDARRYADRSSKSGSEVKLHIWQGMAHVFPANLALLEAAREALDIAGASQSRAMNKVSRISDQPQLKAETK